MKNTRKILTLLLSMALLVAGFSVTVFANGTDNTDLAAYNAALAEDSDVLEFYEAGTYFEMRVDANGNLVVSESEEGKLLKGGAYDATVSDGVINLTSVNATKFNLTQTTPASFGVNVRGKITEDSPLALYVASSATGDYLSLFTVSVGSISHKFNPTTLKYETEDFNLAAGEFFDLSIYVDKANGTDTVYYSLTTEGGATVTDSYSYDNSANDFLSGKFDFDYAYLTTTAASFAYVEMYPGTYQRFVDNSKNVDVIAEKLVKTYNDYVTYKSVSGTKGAFDLAEIVAKIAVRYEYPVNAIANEETKAAVTAAFADCVNVVSKTYEATVVSAKAVMESADNDAKAYNDRLTLVNEVLSYNDYMTLLASSDYAEASGVDFEAVNAAFEVANAEADKLLKIEADTIFVIDAVSVIYNVYLSTYEELKAVYEKISEIAISDTYYSDDYAADVVADAVYKRNVVVSNYPMLDAKAKTFATNVQIAKDTTVAFSERYAAYTLAKENVFTDNTYDKYLTGVTVSELNEIFAVVDVEMKAVSEVAEAFLSKIREAEQTPSYTVKIKALDAAKPYIDVVETGYPEVAAAIDSYNAMRADVTARQEAARKYIQSVINVQIATSVKEKLAAIELAEAYAVLGNESSVEVEGMSMTVTEANIVLAYEKSDVELKITRINNYTTAVSEISKKTDLLACRQAINYALTLKAGLTIDAAEEDVVNATAALDAAIAAYNADVNEANTAAKTTETASLTLLTKTIPTKRIAEIVAIVKKFYE